MTYIIQPGSRRTFSARILTIVVVGFVLIVLQANTTQAQWATSGTNISNTNTGNVGVGTTTTTPSERLTVVAQDAVSNGVTQVLSIAHTTTGTPAAGLGAGFTFRAKRSDGSTGNIGHIAGIWEDPTNGTEDGALIFAPILNSAGFGTERMRITSNGNVGIGTMAPAANLEVSTAANSALFVQSTGANNIAQIKLTGRTNSVDKFWYISSRGGYDTPVNRLSFFDSGIAERVTFLDGGNVGIGTAAPANPLQINSGTIPANAQVRVTANGLGSLSLLNYAADNIQIGFDVDWSGSSMTARNTSVARIVKNAGKLTFSGNTGQTVGSPVSSQPDRLAIDLATGNVGIGVAPSANRLEVAGSLNATGTITGGTIQAKYQDVAEWVESSQALAAGTVVVLDQTRSNQVIASFAAYDTRVAGVISLQPGITLGESGANKVLVATTGRVRVKVDASRAPIRIGDLLVTSDIPGLAMKSEPIMISRRQIHSPGTLIGKALEPLEKGTGEILVLLSLQ